MITDILRNEGDYFRVRFICDSTLTLAETMGFFDRIMLDDRFLYSLPLIRIDVDDEKEEIYIEHYKNAFISKEIMKLMKNCGFELNATNVSDHTGRQSYFWIIKWKKKSK